MSENAMHQNQIVQIP